MVDPLMDEVCIYYNGYSRASVIQLVTMNTAYGYGWYEKAVGNVTWRTYKAVKAKGRVAAEQCHREKIEFWLSMKPSRAII